jgi:NADPH:quinone reductase-like Zn-dependent oxidoreductase
VEVPVGQPGPDEVLIEVRAAGVNPVDYKIYAGVYGTDPSSLPMRLGYEASGVVRAVGEGAEGPGGPLRR